MNVEIKATRVSIIVPIFNVEKYINRCLESIIAQQQEGIEVICVEDCSTDGSKKILQEYENNTEIKVVYNEKNVGLGEARNIGLSEAKGEYIWFVDSDDWIEPDAIEELYDIATSNKLDVLCFRANQAFEDSIAKDNPTYNENAKAEIKIPLKGTEALDYLVSRQSYDGTAWSKIYKKDLIENIRFPVGVYYEDEIFSLRVMLEAKSVMLTSNRYYNYYRRVNSITLPNSGISEKHYISQLKLVYDVGKLMPEYTGRELDILCYFHSKMVSSLIDKYRQVDAFSRDYLLEWKQLYHSMGMVGGTLYNGFFPRKLSPEIMSVLRKEKKIYIYGAGKVGQGLFELLTERDIGVNSFVVSDKKMNQAYAETPIVSVNELSREELVNSILLVAMVDIEACQGIKEVLIEKGVREDCIYTYYEIR